MSSDDLDTDSLEKRPQFGTRFLLDKKNVFEHNAWNRLNDTEYKNYKKLMPFPVTLVAVEDQHIFQHLYRCCMLGAGPRLFSQFRRLTIVGVSGIIPRTRLLCEDTQARRKPQGGGRVLKDWNNVFKYNAWDNVVWDDAQEAAAKSKVEENSEVLMTPEDIKKLDYEAAVHWDAFYDIHQNRFFKDRNWLFTEFPELAQTYCESTSLTNCESTNLTNVAIELPNSSELQCKEKLSELEHIVDKAELERTIVPEKEEVIAPSSSETIDCDVKNISSVNSEESFPGEHAKFRILEVGCGVGNTIFPILKTNNSKDLLVYGCDFSSHAVDIVKASEDYEKERASLVFTCYMPLKCSFMTRLKYSIHPSELMPNPVLPEDSHQMVVCFAFVCDVASEEWNTPFPEGSLDLIVCIFVLSAIHPDRFNIVAEKMASYLKPGGMILFRDYGRYDLAQLRFKKGRCLSENFYARGDGTRCYFFTQDEIRQLMTSAGLEEVQNLVDRRLQVNRGKRLTMYRVWVQAKYRKPL